MKWHRERTVDACFMWTIAKHRFAVGIESRQPVQG